MNGQRFKERVAVVTGGNKGIGLGVAKAYAREGASVAITGRDDKTLQAAARVRRVHWRSNWTPQDLGY